MSDPNTFLVDDADIRVRYSAGWELAGSSSEFNQTTHFTTTAGASFTFTFVGTSVSVFGTIDNLAPRPNSTYELDGTTPVAFEGALVQGVIYQQLFYQSPKLPSMEHTLVGRCADAGSRIFLDFLAVAAPLVATTTTQTESPSTPVSTTPSIQTSPAGNSNSSKINITAIVGGAVGGTAFLAMLLLLWWWLTIHRKLRAIGAQTAGYQAQPVLPLIIPSSHYETRGDSPVRTSMSQAPREFNVNTQHLVPHPPTTPAHSSSYVGINTSVGTPSIMGAASSYYSSQTNLTSAQVASPVRAKGNLSLTHVLRTAQSDDGNDDNPPPAYR